MSHEQSTRTTAVEHQSDNLQAEFHRLADRCRQETAHLSSAHEAAKHPACRQIVQMGNAAVPLILRELEASPSHWFPVLQEITGAQPVAPELRGRLELMAAAWLNWGRANGYQW